MRGAWHQNLLLGFGSVFLSLCACDDATAPERPPTEASAPRYRVPSNRSASELGAMVAELYAPLSDSPVSVETVRARGALYEVVLRKGGEQHRVFITRDGRHIADGVTDVDAYREQLTRSLAFVQCVKAGGLSVFVNSQQSGSLQQRRAFGPAADRLLIDCASSPSNCANLGVRVFPTTKVGDVIHPGMRSTAFIETATGCKY